jgi:hypothetical protein
MEEGGGGGEITSFYIVYFLIPPSPFPTAAIASSATPKLPKEGGISSWGQPSEFGVEDGHNCFSGSKDVAIRKKLRDTIEEDRRRKLMKMREAQRSRFRSTQEKSKSMHRTLNLKTAVNVPQDATRQLQEQCDRDGFQEVGGPQRKTSNTSHHVGTVIYKVEHPERPDEIDAQLNAFEQCHSDLIKAQMSAPPKVASMSSDMYKSINQKRPTRPALS